VLNLGYLDPNKTHVARPMEIRTGQQTANSQTITTQERKTTATDSSKTTNQTTATTERAIARKENTTATRV